MDQPEVPLKDRVDRIAREVASEVGAKVQDGYPCLVRVGDNWEAYPFTWEPFRELAGPLEWPEGAPPIVMVSGSEPEKEPHVGTHSMPFPHLRIRISPAVPLPAIVEIWIAQLAGQVPARVKAADEFLKHLDLKPDDVSAGVRQFLGLEEPPKTEPSKLSATMQGVAKELEGSEVTAFAIAEALRTRHTEYASHRLGRAALEAPEGAEQHPWELWRDSVAKLYDPSLLSKSHHQVIDGRLFIVGLGLLEKPLREALEAAEVWAPLLLEIDEVVVGASGPLREALNAIQLAHGYRNDRTTGDDQLGIQGEVNALCEVIMDPDVKPPLAVGLFGVWGSGKSFFMEKMRQRVHALTKDAPADRPRNVVQIRFNAWHYADTSLWASLAVEIFERLADPEPVDEEEREGWLKSRGDPRREEREKLLANLETYREARSALKRERASLGQKQGRLRKRRLRLEEARKKSIAEFPLTNVASELAKDGEVTEALQKVATELGLKPAINQLSSMAGQLRTVSGFATATWQRVKSKKWTIGLLATAVVLLVFGVAATLSGTLADSTSWLGAAVAGIGSVATTVTAASRFILPAARKVNSGLERINAALEKADEVEAKLLAQRSREEQELDLTMARHDEQIEETTRGIAALDEKIASTSAEIDTLTVGRRLYDFLADRAVGYQKHQGVVGMLHRDFRLLDAQLRAQTDRDAGAGLPRIDRVVLYIDDLDRCSPEKVLEVLEAVHLLLALELFIVVVGVDPRWLQRSLRHQYRDLCLGDDITHDPYLQAMPTEYLEKIFQIPLTLPAMEAKAFGQLISSLAPGTAVPEIPTGPGPSTGSTRRTKSPDAPGGARAPTRALLQVQPGSAAEGSGGTSIDLTSDEVLFVQKLNGLVDTPRAAKRLMNTYRLIRATQHVGSRSRFLGADGKPGECYAVLTLLAIAAGYPTLADRVLVALEDHTANIATWSDFVDALEPGQGNLVPDDIAAPPDDDLLAQAEAAEWANMHGGLVASLEKNELGDMEPYRSWGRTVARFSFTL
jgi:hypothetical protein